MRPVQIKDANADFAKPKDWNDEAFGPCGSLPVRREVVGAGGAAYVAHFSNWKPNADEVAALQAGGVVELECCGVQPAVSVSVVPCADPDAGRLVTEQYLRNVFAEALERESSRSDNMALAAAVRNGTDNSLGGCAAMAALRRVAGLLT